MVARIIDGKAIAAELRSKVARDVQHLATVHGLTPGLAFVLVDADPANEIYVRAKSKATVAAGVRSFEHRLATTASESELLALIATLNTDRRSTVYWCSCRCRRRSIAQRDRCDRSCKGRRWFSSAQCRAARHRPAGTCAVHAARLRRLWRSIVHGIACGHGGRRDRPLQHRRQAAGAAVARARMRR